MFSEYNFDTFRPIIAVCFTVNDQLISAGFWQSFWQEFEYNFGVLFKDNFDKFHQIYAAFFIVNFQIIYAGFWGRFGRVIILMFILKVISTHFSQFLRNFSRKIVSIFTQVFGGHFDRVLMIIWMDFLK